MITIEKVSLLELIPVVSPFVLMLIGIINLAIAIMVFRFNRKNSLSKVSVLPIQYEKNKRSTFYNTNMDLDIYKLDKYFLSGKGFPTMEDENPKLWSIKVMNKGNLVSTNLKINLSLIIQKSEFDFNEEELEVSNHEFVLYKEVKREIIIPYMAADSEKEFDIVSLLGDFPSAKLVIDRMETNEVKFIKKPVVIDEYIHSGFSYLQDEAHYRCLLGIQSKSKV